MCAAAAAASFAFVVKFFAHDPLIVIPQLLAIHIHTAM